MCYMGFPYFMPLVIKLALPPEPTCFHVYLTSCPQDSRILLISYMRRIFPWWSLKDIVQMIECPEVKEVMEENIPIFRALTENEVSSVKGYFDSIGVTIRTEPIG
jgi:hypothetical protein